MLHHIMRKIILLCGKNAGNEERKLYTLYCKETKSNRNAYLLQSCCL